MLAVCVSADMAGIEFQHQANIKSSGRRIAAKVMKNSSPTYFPPSFTMMADILSLCISPVPLV